MSNNRVIKITFFISFLGHLLLFAIPVFDLNSPYPQEPEDMNIVLRLEIPPLLPEIKVLGEEKKLKKEELIEPEPIPEPIPEPEPILEPEPEPEPRLQPEETVIEDLALEHDIEFQPEPNPIFELKSEPVVEPLPEPGEKIVKADDPQEEAMLRYQDIIRQRIEAHRRYPRWAKKQGFEGTVDVQFVVLPNGQAKDIIILRSSGFSILDDEAVSNVKRASPFPPIPKKLNRSQFAIEVVIVFRLN